MNISPGTGVANISPIGFHHYASEFATSARQAQAAGRGSAFSPVPYYLYCRSLELGLKAFLLAKGGTLDELKSDLGHDLGKILREARGRGLEQTVPFAAHWEDELRKANAYYPSKGFEYFEIKTAVRGYPQLPALDVLNEIVTTLLKGIERICLDV
jgi:hypothetical protein